MAALIVLALPICIADIKYHRIPNIYLILIFYVVALEQILTGVFSVKIFLLAASLLFVLQCIAGIGMGDVKLILLICATLNLSRAFQLGLLLLAICVSASLMVIIYFVVNARIPRQIALAPAILMGVGLYLCAGSVDFLQEYAHALVNSW
ncbi:MAG: hypothetical protein F2766_02860 [Actinobacteria bacterium]|jgi:Flp pilus assembly protein protease CpaA|uniref:Unannotated protein n=1 Tax=freshwater metagenome TaxID=449393 RepID=A0A6J6RAQ5_9ZZZZ|nr:hypothetical protein [Actinomycetota bacterium]MSY35556.1 hypothetical protein [Actinomycetota bacterium]MTB28966.1 hypothetical protein [Actinomycetota bacterium]MUH49058.1 hypothetical protein [Actinomycetota bacterium]